MADSALLSGETESAQQSLPAQGFERLQELMRHGYVPDHRRLPGSQGLLLRHESAPDLILRPDGTIDVPVGQPLKRAVPAAVTAVPERPKRRWLRALLILMGVVVYTIACAIVLAALAESM